MDCSTRPSNVRVCQFRHSRMYGAQPRKPVSRRVNRNSIQIQPRIVKGFCQNPQGGAQSCRRHAGRVRWYQPAATGAVLCGAASNGYDPHAPPGSRRSRPLAALSGAEDYLPGTIVIWKFLGGRSFRPLPRKRTSRSKAASPCRKETPVRMQAHGTARPIGLLIRFVMRSRNGAFSVRKQDAYHTYAVHVKKL